MNNIHSTAIIYDNVIIGEGNTIGPYCIIGSPPEWKGKESKYGKVYIGNNNVITGLVTIDAPGERMTIIGDNCYIMKHAHIGHDCVIGNNVTISCGAKIGGHAVIGSDCNVGLNAVIHQWQIIKSGCMIGMGAVVTKKLITEPYNTYAGNPAKLISKNTQHPNYTIFLKESL